MKHSKPTKTVRIPADAYARLQAFCQKEGRIMGSIVALAVDEYLEIEINDKTVGDNSNGNKTQHKK